MKIHNLGFPRIGANRELKRTLEAYWQGDIEQAEFYQQCRAIRQTNWQLQQKSGIELLPVGDFAHYDHVLNTSLLLGVIPKRFTNDLSALDREFQIARGKSTQGCGCAASDMTKWFNTNYHYLVPEITQEQSFEVNPELLIEQIREAKALGHNIKPVLLGPISYLYLAAGGDEKLNQLPYLIAAYNRILAALNKEEVEWLQIDEPILGLELSEFWLQAFVQGYNDFTSGDIKVLLATYFANVDHHTDLIKTLPVHGIHLDVVAEQTDTQKVITQLPKDWIISLGVINGRNVWKSDLAAIYQKVLPLAQQLNERLWLAPSCSLLHSPVTLESEHELNDDLKSWLAFSVEKCHELALLKSALITSELGAIEGYSQAVKIKHSSYLINNAWVERKLLQLPKGEYYRQTGFEKRKIIQQQSLNLPLYPTTTIGSFPQTAQLRKLRADWRAGRIEQADYQDKIESVIATTIKIQESLGLDVLVHGEAERNDMVEYFGELLGGVAFTKFGWVQSYGSRCVKPPIIYGDVSRKHAMTTHWLKFAQSLTNKPVKAMLTGPVTILAWSFVRDDIPRELVAKQIALAISDEVNDLEKQGLKVIQIDEPAIREAMPIKQSQWDDYLAWASRCFRLSALNAKDSTQIHTHMCYSEFNEILPAITSLDADVITIETSRSNMSLLNAFESHQYPNDIGPGVYDIHSPNVPSVDWIVSLIEKAENVVDKERLWVNPDCGLKTRQWPETQKALTNMVEAAQILRSRVSK